MLLSLAMLGLSFFVEGFMSAGLFLFDLAFAVLELLAGGRQSPLGFLLSLFARLVVLLVEDLLGPLGQGQRALWVGWAGAVRVILI